MEPPFARSGQRRYPWAVAIVGLKLLLAPVLIALASLAARRWGPSVGGWLIALPLTSGPVLFFLALDHGASFAAAAAVGALAGLAAIAAFALAYAVGGRPGPLVGFAYATTAFVLTGLGLQLVLDDPTWAVLAVVLGAVSVALRWLPDRGTVAGVAAHPRWDIPARMVAVVLLVFGLSAIAPSLGPRLTGLAATFPVYVSVMTTFTQRTAGFPAAVGLLRGLLVGLYGTAAFFTVLVVGLVPVGIPPAFLAALAAALGIQAVALRSVRQDVALEPA
jgi:hypothetical protein